MKLRSQLLLLVLPLIRCDCPEVLTLLDERDVVLEKNVQEAVDTSCGRRNFTLAFWSDELVQEMLRMMARDSIIKNASLCSVECAEEMDARYNTHSFDPAVQSFRDQLATIDHPQLRAVIAKQSAHYYKFRVLDMTKKSDGHERVQSWNRLQKLYTISSLAEAQAQMSQVLKQAFGYEESTEIRQYRVNAAMNAFKRLKKNGRDVAYVQNCADLIAKLTVSNSEAQFKQIMEECEKQLSKSRIRPHEVLPAVESLYLQWRQLDSTARDDAISTLNSWLGSYTMVRELILSLYSSVNNSDPDLWSEHYNPRVRFSQLSKERAMALVRGFPELFKYLTKNGYM